MSLILNIDTASETALLTLADDGIVIQEETNYDQKNHAAFLHPAIQSLIKKVGITFNDIAAIAVVYGPGSYTGLRVGMASAKGLCFALNKPLITLGSLEVMAAGMIARHQEAAGSSTLFCAMIDARRLEVFTAVYDEYMNVVKQPSALLLHPAVFDSILAKNFVYFLGNGAPKWEQICSSPFALFPVYSETNVSMNKLSYQKFLQKDFAEINLLEPLYLKEFYTVEKIS